MPMQATVERIKEDYNAPAPSHEDTLRQNLIGTWELVSYKVEEKETGNFINAMGPAPRGRVVFTPDGWVAFNLEGSNRLAATTDADRSQLMKTLVAYIGRYRVEGDQWITSVQTAWAPEWLVPNSAEQSPLMVNMRMLSPHGVKCLTGRLGGCRAALSASAGRVTRKPATQDTPHTHRTLGKVCIWQLYPVRPGIRHWRIADAPSLQPRAPFHPQFLR